MKMQMLLKGLQGLKPAVALAGAVLVATPALAVNTVAADYLGNSPSSVNITASFSGGPAAPEVDVNLPVGRFLFRQTGGTSTATLLGGSLTEDFLAFCIEPQQFIQNSATYELVPLSFGATSLGGLGVEKALLMRELFGRFAPAGGAGAMTSVQAGAFQVALWEIAQELPTNALDLAVGNVSFLQSSNTEVYNLAQGWLNQLTGDGPLATGLRAMRNGTINTTNGAQDLIVFTGFLTDPIPEPSSWAMLIAGFGLVGAVARRRRAAALA